MKCHLILYLFVLACLLSGCQEDPIDDSLIGVWVGNYQGKREKAPFPAIFQFFPDSTYAIYNRKPKVLEEGKWKLEGNLLKLGKGNWHAYFRKGGKLNLKRSKKISPTYLMLRRPEKNSQLFSIEESNAILSNTAWTNIREIPQNGFCRQDVHTYHDRKLQIHRQYFYNRDTLDFEEIELGCYDLHATTEHQFILFANGENCTRNLAPRQILQLHEDQLALLSYFHDEKQATGGENLPHLFYISLADSLYKPVSNNDSISFFAPCRDEKGQLAQGLQIVYENKDSLISHIKRTFQHFPNSQSGQIEMYLTVDCQGQVGRINLIQKDEKRQPNYFAAPIVKQLFEIAVKYPYRANPASGVDSQRKLIFEIDNGELKEVKVSN